MRATIAIASVAVLATCVGCSSGSNRRAQPAAPLATSITQAPATPNVAARAWTTPVGETSYGGSPGGFGNRPAPQPTGYPMQPSQPQPPMMEGAPQPPVVDDFPSAADEFPEAPAMPAEPTWTTPAPVEPMPNAPMPDADLPGTPISEAPKPAEMPAGTPSGMPAGMPSGMPDLASFEKPGFKLLEQDGRYWVFRDGSDELAAFLKDGAPADSVKGTIPGAPGGMSLYSADLDTIKAFLAAP